MLKTIEWKGMPVITGSLTDFLLSIEDYLDDNTPLFIRLGGVWDLLPRLTATIQKKEEDGLVLSDSLTAGCLSLKTETHVFSVRPELLIEMVLNLASDSNKNVLLISDDPTKYKCDALMNFNQRRNCLSVIPNQGIDQCELMHWIVNRGTTILICDVPAIDAHRIYESMVASSSKAFLWIQMPAQHRASSHVAVRSKENARSIQSVFSYLKAKTRIFLHLLHTELRLS